MKMGMIIHEMNVDEVAEFNIEDCHDLEAYQREICKRLGVEFGSEPIWDSYRFDTGGDYFEDVFSSKKGVFVLPYKTKHGESITIFDNLYDLTNELENLYNNSIVIRGGVYSFPSLEEALEYVSDLKQ